MGQRPVFCRFLNPPIAEIVFSVQFPHLSAVRFNDWIRFWEQHRGQYPTVSVQPPLPDATISDDGPNRGSVMKRMEIESDDFRCWIVSGDDSKLLQLQRTRFIKNWRKRRLTDAYPSYHILRPEFEQEWERFCAFVMKAGDIEKVEPNQCELVYVNHIELNEDKPYDELKSMYTFWNLGVGTALGVPFFAASEMTFDYPEMRARTYVSIKPAVRNEDEKPIHLLQLTCRGHPAGSTAGELSKWFDMAHSKIHEAFGALISDELKQRWGKA